MLVCIVGSVDVILVEMSIKSQKSLYDECSEIVERSYSVRSASEESLSCSDEEECLARELMNKLKPAVLCKLRRCFRKCRERNKDKDIDRRVEEVMRAAAAEEGIEFAATPVRSVDDPLWLSEDVFVSSLDNIFGHHKYTTHAHKLFQLLDPFSTGKVRWRQLVDRLVAVGAKKTSSRVEAWVPVLVKSVVRLEHCKRETIVKLVSVERQDSFCYVAVSRGGRVGVYSGDMALLYTYEVFYHRTGVQRRVKNCWITDAIYLSDVQCIVYSASDRSLTVYDVATLTHTPVYCITGLPHLPTCLAYSPTLSDGTSELAIGSERGDITRLRFLQPKISLFHTKTVDQINYYFWMELTSPPHNTYCSITTWRRVHARSVKRMTYSRDSLTSCSHDTTVSVRKRDTRGKLDDYVLGVPRGVSCYHAVPSLHVVVTGGAGGAVRVWGGAGGAALACLEAPGGAAVLDVALVASRELVIAYCANCSLHIWDMYEECLLQTIKINFPFLGVLGKKVEFGAFCIHPGPTRRPFSPDSPPSSPPASPSRRSSVFAASTGGLVLQSEDVDDTSSGLEDDVEYARFNRAELLVTCCDYVCTVSLSPGAAGELLPPPGDMLRARRPSFWDLPDDVFKASPPVASRSAAAPARPRRPPAPPAPPTPRTPAQFLSPSTAGETEYPVQDLDTLLERAGLQGLLEKDFVLMQGLKHDLSKKIADMQANMEPVVAALRGGAPHLALRTHTHTHAPAPVPLCAIGVSVGDAPFSAQRRSRDGLSSASTRQ